MQHAEQHQVPLNLAAIVAILGTGIFVTTLIVITGDLMTLWPLYLVPIVIASLTYRLAGAIVASGMAAAAITLAIWGLRPDPLAIPELIVGIVAFTASGIVIGGQAQKTSSHHETLEETSIFDPLTGLYKREHLDRRLLEEVHRAARYSRSLAFVLVRVDHCERFKDKFGAYKADLMLGNLAQVLRINSRDTDILGRYDYSSFGLVLPYADREGAQTLASRLARSVADTNFEGDALEPTTHCTVRIESTLYPYDGCDPLTLTDNARRRLEGVCA